MVAPFYNMRKVEVQQATSEKQPEHTGAAEIVRSYSRSIAGPTKISPLAWRVGKLMNASVGVLNRRFTREDCIERKLK